MTFDDAEKLLKATVGFQEKTLKAREICREQYRKAEKVKENSLRIILDGQLGILAEKCTKKIETITPELSYQICVSSSFIRTHFIINDFILEGCIIEAIVLIRKQLESLARLHELDKKPLQKLKGKVPNIQNILKGSAGRMYGHLSEVAHFSTPRVAELLHVVESGELIGPSLLPTYNERNFACFDMHCFIAIYFIAWLVEKLPSWYPGYDNRGDIELLANCVRLALECGVIQMPKEDA